MYIPLSKIDPKQYNTSGGEYILSTTNQYYVGPYHKDTYGNAWTGTTHTNISIKLLVPYQPKIQPNVNRLEGDPVAYSQIPSKNAPPNLSLYQNNSLPPTQDDFNKTYMTRYIISYKLTSKPVYVDVDKNTYFQMINSPDKLYYYYDEVLWKISGPTYDEFKDGVLIKGGIIDSNKRSIQKSENNIPGLSNYLNNLLLYTRPD